MRLLDREKELEALLRSLAPATSGEGRVTLVSGEAGVGKTSLLRVFTSQVSPNIRILRGACEDLRVAEPLGPWRDLLVDVDLHLADRLADSERTFSVFSHVLSALADHPGGTLVVLEDLHWADDATIDLVRFIARRIVDHPICLVVSSRAERVEERRMIRRAFVDLPTNIMNRVELSRLSEAAVSELCRESLKDPSKVFAASGGNAFYVSELLSNAGKKIPLSIRDAVLARIDQLPGDAKSIIQAASIMPRRAEVEHVMAIADCTDAEAAIEICLEEGLLTMSETALSFRHEIAREAVSSSISTIKRQALHKRLFQRLGNSKDAGLPRILHHAQAAGDKSAVAELAPKAARAAEAVGSRREAAEFYLMAVDALADASDASLLEAAAAACYLVGNHPAAAGLQTRALEKIGESDPIRRGDALRKLSRYRWIRSDFSGAFEAVREAIAVLADHRGPELAQAYSSLSQLLMTGFHTPEVEAPATRAIELAREFNRPDIISHALNNLGMSKTHSDPELGRKLLSESIEIGLKLDDPDHAARAMSNWMHFEYHRCEFKNALERAEIAAQFTLENELDAYHRYALGMIGRTKMDLGQWDEVVHFASRGFDPEDRVPENYHFNGAIALLIYQVRTGAERNDDVGEYLALFDHETSEAQRIGPYSEIVAERAWLSGQGMAEAIERLRLVAAKSTDIEAVAGVPVWLNRLGAEVSDLDIARFPKPYLLELKGDIAGAASAWADMGAPYNRALALAFGSPEQQKEAQSTFEVLQAFPAIGRMNEILGNPKNRSRGRPRAEGPYGLTNRQIDVLRLIDEGLTNEQIGARLFISPKTVDHHVSAILSRLEASSRGEAAAKARNEGLL
ncbi:ATP-binding protein [Marivita geojedonensis]|uniref:HTH luxR-type domain-containing protein n=1 Tax=Marivita geojedonensis TaxID=1123756 RepID=A0A1X4NNU3_9RHOB|nr:AAA family ATPase [Marivita geojedonensis]OSQ52413.1 hypothetical protein MGEO_03210 [Marivita geojedonensis]PRY73265.1 LuxR family transcriptional regulator [Marivita geojedonensis]